MPTQTPKPVHIQIVLWILLGGFALSLLCNYIIGNYLKEGYPYNTFFFRPDATFLDFELPYKIADNPYGPLMDPAQKTSNPLAMPDIVPGATWEINQFGPVYFPFAYWLILPFRLFPAAISLLLYLTICIGIFLYICYQEIYKIAGLSITLVIGILSYPQLFLLDRGNFEFFIFIFIYMFFLFYTREPWLSASFLAFAIAAKFVPIGYVLILLGDRKYKQAFFTLSVAALLNLAGYALYPGGLMTNITAHLQNLRISSVIYADGRNVFLMTVFWLEYNTSFSCSQKDCLKALTWARPKQPQY